MFLFSSLLFSFYMANALPQQEDTSNAMSNPKSKPTTAVPNFLIFIVDDLILTKKLNKTFNAPAIIDPNGEYLDIATPYIDEFIDESIVFQRSYTFPKCSPSRFALLTGRSPTYSKWAIHQSKVAEEGVKVTVPSSKIWNEDTINNIPAVLKGKWRTGQIGKWHMMASDDDIYDCKSLTSFPNATKYDQCTDIVKGHGFNFVNGYYHENIQKNQYFSHNPEFMLQQTEHFIKSATTAGMPFFAYIATTLTHSSASALDALSIFNSSQTPKGVLTGSDIPNVNLMSNRSEILNKAYASNVNQSNSDQVNEAAAKIWVDNLFGNLINYLKINNLYNNTFIVFLNDHGMGAKAMLYEQGIRIAQAIRYPKLFGTNGYILPPDFITSTIDLASIIFELANIDIKTNYTNYTLDQNGNNWKDDVLDYINGVEYEPNCCEYRIFDIYNSHAIVTKQYKYIFRATDKIIKGRQRAFYPYVYDTEQLYDLETDPSEQVNLIDNNTLQNILFKFRIQMSDYIQLESCFADNIADCVVPNISYIPPTPQPTTPTTPQPTPQPTRTGYNCDFVQQHNYQWRGRTSFREKALSRSWRRTAEQDYLNNQVKYCGIDFSNIEYVYNFTKIWNEQQTKFTVDLDMQICCPAGKSLGNNYISSNSLNGYKRNDIYKASYSQPIFDNNNNINNHIELIIKCVIAFVIFCFICFIIVNWKNVMDRIFGNGYKKNSVKTDSDEETNDSKKVYGKNIGVSEVEVLVPV